MLALRRRVYVRSRRRRDAFHNPPITPPSGGLAVRRGGGTTYGEGERRLGCGGLRETYELRGRSTVPQPVRSLATRKDSSPWLSGRAEGRDNGVSERTAMI